MNNMFYIKNKFILCSHVFLSGLLCLMGPGKPMEPSAVPMHPGIVAAKGLFDTDEVLEISLKGNIRPALNDRSKKPKSYPVALSYKTGDSTEISIPVEIKTRGHFRKTMGNCTYPPIQIQFQKNGPQLSTIFSEQEKLKLVMPCSGDDYVIREWLVYKLYNLVTRESFRARLVKVTLDDDKRKKAITPFYGILLEEEGQLAKRNNSIIVERKLKPQSTQVASFLTTAVFQYLIGNTDWSVEYLQNIKLLAADSNAVAVTVPYDFDHAGIVDAPYAKPAEELQLNSIRERRYRGYCIEDLKIFEDIIAHYNRLKNDIYGLYTSCTLLDQKYIRSTTKFLDDFFTTINTPKSWQKDFAYPCDKNGTGNVIIKGLKEDN